MKGIYQRLSPRLHFNATNFQHYVKAGHGTNFILLHFWFHTLIVLLHQPTLLHSFEGRIQQLFPDSRELSMSSAKTIADILAFAELIDVKSFIGNPFTSQPMYVAACAFLAEAAAHTSQPPSRATSPPSTGSLPTKVKSEFLSERMVSEQKAASARHTLLATAANQNYQRCYKALKTLDSYWAGCRYILTALDQKAKGLMDPILFTAEDIDGEMPSTEPSFTTPGWRRSTSLSASLGAYGGAFNRLQGLKALESGMSFSPKMDLSQVIGWSLTGTANSPAPNLSVLYPNAGGDEGGTVPTGPQGRDMAARNQRFAGLGTGQTGNIRSVPATTSPNMIPVGFESSKMAQTSNRLSNLPYDPVSTAEADLLLGLHSPYASDSTSQPMMVQGSSAQAQNTHAYDYLSSQTAASSLQQQPFMDFQNQSYNNMMIESQDIDMSGQQLNFNFPGGDMIPWLEYLPQDVLNYFGEPQGDDDGFMARRSAQPG